MAEFTPSKKIAQDFNNGIEYVNGYDDETGDVVNAETINNVIESQLWTQALATNPIDNSEANKVGTPSITLETMPDGTPQFKTNALKGETGNGIASILPNGIDTASGGNKYTVTMTNGDTYTIIAPKGEQGDPANIDLLKSLFVNKSGDTMTGNLQLDEALLSKHKDNPVYILPLVKHEEIEPTHNTYKYFGELLKWICQNYPNVEGGTWIGRAAPNSRGICMLSIYNTARVNNEGLPEYSEGFWQSINATDNLWHFATNSYNYVCQNLGETYAKKIDTEKLKPTTANGWTVGGSDLALPSNGIYLVSINSALPFIIVYESSLEIAAVGMISPTSRELKNIYFWGRDWVYNSFYSPEWESPQEANSVAYKKIA